MTSPAPTVHSGGVPTPRLLRRTASSALRAIRPRLGLSRQQPGEEEVDPRRAQKVLDLALRIADLMLSHGASANDVTLTAIRVVRAYGLSGAHVDVTFTSITVSYHPGQSGTPLTMTRVVRSRSTDYTRLLRIQALVDNIERGLSIDQATNRFVAILSAARPYRPWVVSVGNAVLALGVCLMLGAGPFITVIAAASTAAIERLQALLGRKAVPPFFAQAAGAAVPTSAAVIVMALSDHGLALAQDTRPSLIVTSGIVYLLAGMSVVGAAQDAIDGFYVTAGARAFEVMVLTLGIVVGIIAVLQLGTRLGVPLYVSGDDVGIVAPVRGFVGAVVVSCAFAVATQAGPRTVLFCGAMGAVAQLGYMAMITIGMGVIGASAVGAMIAAFLAAPVARRYVLPALALTTAAIVPLMPGSRTFSGILTMVTESEFLSSQMAGFATLLTAAGIGMALAAGASLGTYFARPVRDRLLWRRKMLSVARPVSPALAEAAGLTPASVAAARDAARDAVRADGHGPPLEGSGLEAWVGAAQVPVDGGDPLGAAGGEGADEAVAEDAAVDGSVEGSVGDETEPDGAVDDGTVDNGTVDNGTVGNGTVGEPRG